MDFFHWKFSKKEPIFFWPIFIVKDDDNDDDDDDNDTPKIRIG